MATAAQVIANRKNAESSTGPRSLEGKRASSQNSTRHGLSGSTHAVLPGEDPDDFEALVSGLEQTYEPCTEVECILIDQMAKARWKILRIARLEAEAYEELLTNPEGASVLGALAQSGNIFEKLQRYADAAERSFYKALRELEKLQSTRAKRATASFNEALERAIFAPPPSRLQNEPNSERPASAPSGYKQMFSAPSADLRGSA